MATENMVQCDKEEALKAREIAIKKMEGNDFVAAQKIVLEAQKLFPELDGVSQLLTVCNVHCAAEACVNGQKDWYRIFQVEETADKTIIRKQYLNLIQSLHTDRNGFPGAEAAFKLVGAAYSVLKDPTQRKKYDIKTDKNVFWTKCLYCQTGYKYYFCILNRRVRCQKCSRNFVASVFKEQVRPTSSTVVNGSEVPRTICPNQKYDTPSHEVHHVKSSSVGQVADVKFQMLSLNQYRHPFPTDNENMHVSPMSDPAYPNIVDTHKSGINGASAKPSSSGFVGKLTVNVAQSNEYIQTFSSADCKNKAERSAMLHEVVGIPMTNNNTGGKCMPYHRDPNILRVNLGSEEASKVPSAAVKTSKRHTRLNSDNNKRQRENDSLSTHVDRICKQRPDGNVINVGREPAPTHMSREGNIKEKAKTTSTGNQGGDISCEHDTSLQKNAQGANPLSDKHLSPHIYTYPDPEFHRFEEDRSCEKFERGQIWALYDSVDTFPRFYGWISKVKPEPFTVHLIWLEVYPQQEQEKRWVEQEISISCGTFRVLDRRAQYDTTYTFSHLVDVRETRIPNQVKILPEVGEVWAIYMNWAPDWTPSSISACEFAVGEVVEHTEASTKLWLLSKVDGYVSVFQPNVDEENGEIEIPAQENLRFSHRIPSVILNGEKGGELCGFYELDPASVPYVQGHCMNDA